MHRFYAAVFLVVSLMVQSPAITRAANNCLACVRCGGSWAVGKDGDTMYAQCLYPPATGAVNLTMYSGLVQGTMCTAGAPNQATGVMQCASVCGPEGPCPAGSICGECLFAKSNTQCVTPASPKYPAYNTAVHAACDAISSAGFPVATNAALLYGMSLPVCDCPPGQSYSTDTVTCTGAVMNARGGAAAGGMSAAM